MGRNPLPTSWNVSNEKTDRRTSGRNEPPGHPRRIPLLDRNKAQGSSQMHAARHTRKPTKMKCIDFKRSIVRRRLARMVRHFYEASAVTFWKIEAREWRKLYQEQRGGEAFNSIQLQLADARAEIQRLSNLPNKYDENDQGQVRPGGPLPKPHGSAGSCTHRHKSGVYCAVHQGTCEFHSPPNTPDGVCTCRPCPPNS
jgi:hypothetical protein